jgi:hypothetical protein
METVNIANESDYKREVKRELHSFVVHSLQLLATKRVHLLVLPNSTIHHKQIIIIIIIIIIKWGWDIAVDIASRCGLDGPGIESRSGFFRNRLDPAFCTTGTGFFPWVKRPGRGVDYPPPSSAEVKERVELISTPPMGLCDLYWGELELLLNKHIIP